MLDRDGARSGILRKRVRWNQGLRRAVAKRSYETTQRRVSPWGRSPPALRTERKAPQATKMWEPEASSTVVVQATGTAQDSLRQDHGDSELAAAQGARWVSGPSTWREKSTCRDPFPSNTANNRRRPGSPFLKRHRERWPASASFGGPLLASVHHRARKRASRNKSNGSSRAAFRKRKEPASRASGSESVVTKRCSAEEQALRS